MAERSALLIVDVQNDFCPGGALPVPQGDAVVPVLNGYLACFKSAGLPIFASRDWHPPVTKHFKEYGGPWPSHCVQNTSGAAFRADLLLPEDALVVTKGDDPDADAYSAFQGRVADGRSLAEVVRAQSVERLYVGGLATDYCVRASVLDALRAGLRVTVLEDAVRGVDVEPGDSKRALREMEAAGAERTRLETFALAASSTAPAP